MDVIMMLFDKNEYVWTILEEDGVCTLSSRQVGVVEIPLSNGGAMVRPVREVTRAYALPNMGGVMISVENVRR